MNSRLFDRVHNGGTWAYSRRTERKKKIVQLSTKSSRATNLYFLLTTGHAARLAASIFGSSTLSGVCSSGKRGGEIKRIAGGLRLLRVIGREVVT